MAARRPIPAVDPRGLVVEVSSTTRPPTWPARLPAPRSGRTERAHSAQLQVKATSPGRPPAAPRRRRPGRSRPEAARRFPPASRPADLECSDSPIVELADRARARIGNAPAVGQKKNKRSIQPSSIPSTRRWPGRFPIARGRRGRTLSENSRSLPVASAAARVAQEPDTRAGRGRPATPARSACEAVRRRGNEAQNRSCSIVRAGSATLSSLPASAIAGSSHQGVATSTRFSGTSRHPDQSHLAVP